MDENKSFSCSWLTGNGFEIRPVLFKNLYNARACDGVSSILMVHLLNIFVGNTVSRKKSWRNALGK
jgi:hypothetical protein